VTRARQWGRRLLAATLLLSVAFAVGGCRRRPRRAAPPPPAAVGEVETGIASWYGHPYHGRATSSGEIYDMNAMTAAHRTLAFQTVVRVTNLRNNRVTTVRINDRGPFVEGRIIDLSRKAAEEIDMIGPGTAPVRVEIIQQPPDAPTRFAVQVGAFLVSANAESFRATLAKKYGDVIVQRFEAPDGTYFRVRVGRKATLAEARTLADELRRRPDVAATFIVRLD
jgi:rare lipoprotein A